MSRFSIKVAGQSGQGINVVGEILGKALKRAGYFVFAYREYPSLIKGGNATYQIDISDEPIFSPSKFTDILIVLNKQHTLWYLDQMKENGTIMHLIPNPRINKVEFETINKKNIKFTYVPGVRLSQEVGGDVLTANLVTMGSLWQILGLSIDPILSVINDTFGAKPKYLKLDIDCFNAGFNFQLNEFPNFEKRLIKPDEITEEEKVKLHIKKESIQQIFTLKPNLAYQNNLILSGNEALSLGAINAGTRIFYAYPMTPSSSILSYLADQQESTGVIVKQVEDEITAAAMAIGSMHSGTRSLTATSGGGFDLMTEHVSLAAAIEVPFVCVLAQRPGPATGMPTWTTQGDLMLAIFSGHGEFSRAVIAAKDAEDAFYSIQEAFNIAEKYQIPVMVLTDKLLAESLYQIEKLDGERIQIERGLVSDPQKVLELKSTHRYQVTESGISARWLPGTKASDYNANSDEHDEEGNVTEDAEKAGKMIQKRLNKEKTLLAEIPQPEVYSNNVPNPAKTLNIISWGSAYGAIHDAMQILEKENIKINYMHIKYLWPLKTENLHNFLKNGENILIEANHNGQLGQLIKMQTGIDIPKKLLKWDGRPIFYNEIINFINS